MIKCCAFSDIHGILRDDYVDKEVDYLFIAGDLVPLNIQSYSKESRRWFEGTFIPWCLKQPVTTKIIIVAGNHDWYCERHQDETKTIFSQYPKIAYLMNEGFEDDNIKVWGTPMCKAFGNWAFMKYVDNLENIFCNVPDDFFTGSGKKTILLSHDAPYGISDIVLQKSCPWADGSHIGNKALLHLIQRTKPELNLHGHLHTTNHDAEYEGPTEVRCVSLLDEDYKVAYKPYYFEL